MFQIIFFLPKDLHEIVYKRMSRGNLNVNRVFVVDHYKVKIPKVDDSEKHYVQGYIELIFWWFQRRSGSLDVVQFVELPKFERITE